MRRGLTSKPCPACGERDEHNGRPIDKLCFECQRIYNDGLEARRKQSEQTSKIVVHHTNIYHWISRPYLFLRFYSFYEPKLNDLFSKAWSKLTLSVIEKALDVTWSADIPQLITKKKQGWGIDDSSGNNYYLVSPGVRDALNEFDKLLRVALKLSNLSGLREGTDLLSNTNKGNLSLNSYQESIDKVEKQAKELLQSIGLLEGNNAQ